MQRSLRVLAMVLAAALAAASCSGDTGGGSSSSQVTVATTAGVSSTTAPTAVATTGAPHGGNAGGPTTISDPPMSDEEPVATTSVGHGDGAVFRGPDLTHLDQMGPDTWVDVDFQRVPLPSLDSGISSLRSEHDGLPFGLMYDGVFSIAGTLLLLGTAFPESDFGSDEDVSREEADAAYEAYRSEIRKVGWVSEDGMAWERIDLSSLAPFEFAEPVGVRGGAVLAGTIWEAERPYSAVYSTTDGVSWTGGPISRDGEAFLDVVAVGAGEDGSPIVIGRLEPIFEGPADVTVVKDGLRFVQSWQEGTVQVIDEAGTVRFAESIEWLDQFRAESEDGFRIFRPGTSEVLFTIPPDQLDREPDSEGRLEFSVDGYLLQVDVFEGRFAVFYDSDSALFEGLIDDLLWSLIVVPDGEGGTLLEISYREIAAAESAVVEEFEELSYVVLTPSSSEGWSEMPLDLAGGEPSYGELASGPAGFVTPVRFWNDDSVDTAVYRSEDGVTWERLTSAAPPIHTVTSTSSGYLGFGTGERTAAVWESVDAARWEPVLVQRGSVGTSLGMATFGGGGGAVIVGFETWGSGTSPVVLADGDVVVYAEGDFISVRLEDADVVQVLREGFVDELTADGSLREVGSQFEVIHDGEVVATFSASALESAIENYVEGAGLRDFFPEQALVVIDDGTTTGIRSPILAQTNVMSVAILERTVVVFGWDIEGLAGERDFEESYERPVMYVGTLP